MPTFPPTPFRPALYGFDNVVAASAAAATAAAPHARAMKKVRLLVSDRWMRSASKLALEGVNEKLLERCTEAERLENKETLESNAANLAMASVQSHRAEVR